MKTQFPSIIFLIVLFLPGMAVADDPLLILTEQLYPMNYTENGQDDEKILGFATELVTAVMVESGLDYEMNMVPWARAINSIDNNPNVLVFSMTRSPARESKYHWIGEIWKAKINLYGHRDRITEQSFDIENIKNLRIGTQRGSVTREYLQNNGFRNIVTIKTMSSYIRLLDRGRIDLFPYLDFAIDMSTQRQNFDRKKLVIVMELTEISLNLSLAGSMTMDIQKVKRLQTAFAKLKSSGRYQEIMAPLQTSLNKFD